jgi:hypothetical protein
MRARKEKRRVLRQYGFYDHEKKMRGIKMELKKTNQFVTLSWSK